MLKRVSVRVPATCANLGCLFDCGAIAVGLYVDVHVAWRADKEVSVRYQGDHADRVHTDSNNLIARVLRETLDGWGETRGFDLEIENQIPIGAGVGSSAAAIVGGLTASYLLAGRTVTDEDLVSLATFREGHPDNVAAAWHGGFTVAMQSGERVLTHTCPLPDSLGLVLVVPDYALSTEEARKVLPEEYSRADAVHNLQRAAVLTAQLCSGRGDFQRTLSDDRWHQPYRAPLVPGLAEVLLLEHAGLLGVCLSGAGPSLLAFTEDNPAAIGELIQKTLAGKRVNAQIHLLTADNRGAKGWTLPF
jgi:homoserine kinase